MTDADRRSGPRGACALHVYVEPAGDEPIPCRSADLSTTGISVVCDKAISPGTDALFHLRLALGWSGDDFLSLLGRVVWCHPDGKQFRFGAKFDEELTDKQRRRLDRLVRRLLGQDEIGELRQRFGGPSA